MSNGIAPEAPVAKKKGLSTLAWVLIGCGGLALLGVALFVGGVGFLGYKAKQFAEDAEKNPVAAIGKAYAMVTPDVEFVSADETAKTLTLKNTKTGKTITITAEDLEKGRISFDTEDGSISLGGGDEVPTDAPADESSGT